MHAYVRVLFLRPLLFPYRGVKDACFKVFLAEKFEQLKTAAAKTVKFLEISWVANYWRRNFICIIKSIISFQFFEKIFWKHTLVFLLSSLFLCYLPFGELNIIEFDVTKSSLKSKNGLIPYSRKSFYSNKHWFRIHVFGEEYYRYNTWNKI